MSAPAYTSDWRWLAHELRPLRRLQLAAAGCLLAATILSLVDPLIVRWLLDSGLGGRRWHAIEGAVGVFLLVFLGRSAVLSAGIWLAARASDRLTLRLRQRLLRRLLRLDAAFHEQRAAGDLRQQVEQDVEQIGQVGADLLPNSLRMVFGVALTFGVMVFLDWRLSLLALPFVPALLRLTARFRGRLEAAADAVRSGVAGRVDALDETLRGAVQIRLLGAERFFLARYRRRAAEVSRSTLEQRRLELGFHAAFFAAVTLATAGMLGAGAYELMHGRLTLGSYIAFYTYLTRLFAPLGAAVETNAKLQRAGGSIRRIAALEQLAPAARAPAGRQSTAPTAPAEAASFGCGGVRFGYGGGRPILRGVDLRVRRGEKVALVGESGGGKTTLTKLLAGLYEPQVGAVHLGGSDVRRLRPRSLRERISLVAPDTVLFAGSLRDNALLGRRGVGAEELGRLARATCFDRVVEGFEGGWDHVLGGSGKGLSDGERQRLGLLRALLHGGEVLILDESTGALDLATETEVLDGLRECATHQAVILVTHRLTAAAWADRTLALEDGELVERERSRPARTGRG